MTAPKSYHAKHPTSFVIAASVLALLLAMTMLVNLSSDGSDAESIPTYEGTCGDGLTWSMKNNVVFIDADPKAGDCLMVDYDENGGPWGREVTSVTVNTGVKSIGNNAFRECKSLKTLVIWANLDEIGDYAFYEDRNLKYLYLTAADHIGSYAFANTSIGNQSKYPLAKFGELGTVGEKAFLGQVFFHEVMIRPGTYENDYACTADGWVDPNKLENCCYYHCSNYNFIGDTAQFCVATFDNMGHGERRDPAIVDIPGSVGESNRPDNLHEPGYAFNGWSTDPGYPVLQSLDSGISENTTFYAWWTEVPEGYDNYPVHSWLSLQTAVEDTTQPRTLILQRAITCLNEDALVVDSGKVLTIDLNGHGMDRDGYKSWMDFQAIIVRGGATLNIIDSGGDGMITGAVSKLSGAISVTDNSTLNIIGCSISGNISRDGGAIYCDPTSTVRLNGTVFEDNHSDGNGGAVFCEGTLVMENVTFRNNDCTGEGAGVYATGHVEMTGCTFIGNMSGSSGGAVRMKDGEAHITGCTFEQNTASGDMGGAILATDGAGLYVSGGTFTGNSSSMYGGAVYFDGADLFIGGDLRAEGNVAPSGSDILILPGSVLRIIDGNALTDGAHVSVSVKDTSAPFSQGYAESGSAEGVVVCGGMAVGCIDGELRLNPNGDVEVTTWSGLQNAINNASDGQTIVIKEDLNANGKDRILVKSGKNVIVDLNSHKVDRQRGSSSADGHVFEVKGTLTIIDTGAAGIITGGYATRGGGINIGEGGVCNIYGGTITGNRAGVDGGGIYVRGVLNMTGGTVSNNQAKDTGGGIYCNETCRFTLTNVLITRNQAENDGGGLCIHMRDNSCTITDCTISFNKSRTEDGGAFRMKQSGRTLTVTNTVINGNWCENDGGAICLYDGKIVLKDCMIMNNTAEKGGAIFSEDEIVIDGTTMYGNSASKDGGAVYAAGDSKVTMESGMLSDNRSDKSGAAVFVGRGGTFTIKDGDIVNNHAGEHGGAVYVSTFSDMYLSGGNFTHNLADQSGGAILVPCILSLKVITISGSPVIMNNSAPEGCNMYISGDPGAISDFEQYGYSRNVIIDGITDGARIGISLSSVRGIVSSWTKTEDPSAYLFSSDGYEVYRTDGNYAAVKSREYFDVVGDDGFIPWNEQIADRYTLSSYNWMSGLSGELYLNEINIPVTHDSATARVHPYGNFLGDIGDTYANCQVRMIDEQLRDGIRGLDLRLNCFSPEDYEPDGLFYQLEDDGKGLYLCHGKQWVGSYFALNYDGDFLEIREVLEWVKTFLREHPTETVIIDLAPECQWDENFDKIMKRMAKILRNESKEINPSTGEPYFYWEDGRVLGEYTHVPQLKECRGKMVIQTGEAYLGVIGGMLNEKLVTVYSPYGSYQDADHDRIVNTRDFYKWGHHPPLPTDVYPGSHIPYLYSVGTNGTDEPWQTPLDIAGKVLPALFDKYKVFDNIGQYYGRVSMDGCTAYHAGKIWKTNFFDGIQYVTVTVDPGLDGYDVQQYKLMKGTKITIPGCIYDIDQDATGHHFIGWRSDKTSEHIWPGDTMVLDGDMTFTAQWYDTLSTPIRIVWDDGDDVDGLRPESLRLMVNGINDETGGPFVRAADGWVYEFTGGVYKITPAWERIDTVRYSNGIDAPGQYRFSVSGNTIDGYTITLKHTHQDAVSISGTVQWNDNDDAEVKRPGSVTLSILADGKEFRTLECLAENEWVWEAADLPKNIGSRDVVYTVVPAGTDYYAWQVIGYEVTFTFVDDSRAIIDMPEDADVRGVIAMIYALPENIIYSTQHRNMLEDAQAAYDALSDDQKGFVQNYDLLQRKWTEYNTAHHRVQAKDMINTIDTEVVGKITEYDPQRYNDLSMINASYNLLHEEAKSFVTNYNLLVDAMSKFTLLMEESISETIYLIDQIAVADDPDAAISAARASFNSLDSVQQRQLEKKGYQSMLEQAEAGRLPILFDVTIEGWKYGEYDPSVNGLSILGSDGEAYVHPEGIEPTITYSASGLVDELVPGTYTVTVSYAAGTTHQVRSATAEFTITGVPVGYSASFNDPEYDGNRKVLQTVVGDLTVDTDYSVEIDLGRDTDGPIKAGVYEVTISLIAPQYVFIVDDEQTRTVTVMVEITKAVNEITSFEFSGWVYGDSPSTAQITALFGTSTARVLYSDSADGVFKGYVPTAAGTWYARAYVPAASNYTEAILVQSFEITRAPVTVTADDMSKTYGETDPVLTATVLGLKYDDTPDVLAYTVARSEGENAGTYTITVTGATSQGNYDLSFFAGDFTIYRADATVTVDALTKVYGDADPVLTATVSGLFGTDTVTYTVTRAAGEDVGEYAVTVTGEAIQGNYNVSFVNGTFAVTRAAATVTADAASKTYGEVDPAFTAAVTGLRNGDAAGVISYTLSRAAGEVEGVYAIVPAGDAVQGNYNVAFVSGTFTILPVTEVLPEVREVGEDGSVSVTNESVATYSNGDTVREKDVVITDAEGKETARSKVVDVASADGSVIVSAKEIVDGGVASSEVTVILNDVQGTVGAASMLNAAKYADMATGQAGLPDDVQRTVTIDTGSEPRASMTSEAFGVMAGKGMVLSIMSEAGTLSYDSGAIGTFSKQADDVTLSMKLNDVSVLTEAQSEAIGDSEFVSVSAMSGSTYISQLNGTVTMAFRFANEHGWKSIVVYYVADDGSKEAVDSSYDAANGIVTVRSSHHSVYAVMEDSESDDHQFLIWIAAAVVAVAAVGVLVVIQWRKKGTPSVSE